MPKLLERWRKRRERQAEQELERLEEASEHGPDALRRFQAATRRILGTPKDDVVKRRS